MPLPIDMANTMIENAIGFFEVPLGVVKEFVVNGKSYTIPMATEETSVIAALQKTAIWIKRHGEMRCETIGALKIGQIQIPIVDDVEGLKSFIQQRKNNLIDAANAGPAETLYARGGGVKDLVLRLLNRPNGQIMGVIHVHMDCGNAMGANRINQVCEFLGKQIVSSRTSAQHADPGSQADARDKIPGSAPQPWDDIGLCILSNLNDTNLTRATLTLRTTPELAHKIAEASLFAQIDPYRAATHNKGIMNGIDAVTLATGNDWRAVEAGLHAYAAHTGTYQPLATWTCKDDILTGTFQGPINVGIVGGAISVHPTAQKCLELLNIQSAQELARVIAAVGLAQNLGALRALVTDGIVKGHMHLHIKNLIRQTKANPEQIPHLRAGLFKVLKEKGYVSLTDAKRALTKITL